MKNVLKWQKEELSKMELEIDNQQNNSEIKHLQDAISTSSRA